MQVAYFSQALDESTDISDISQLLIFIWTVNENFSVCAELLKVSLLHGTTKGIDIRVERNSFVAIADAYGQGL